MSCAVTFALVSWERVEHTATDSGTRAESKSAERVSYWTDYHADYVNSAPKEARQTGSQTWAVLLWVGVTRICAAQQHEEKKRCCYYCYCTLDRQRQCGDAAAKRAQHGQCLCVKLASGGLVDFGGVVDCVRWEFEFVWWWECVVASAGCKFVRSACLSLSACPPASLAARCLAAFKSCSLSRPPSLPSLIHILCTRGCLILVDQTSNTRGHLRPPPSWWCVRPCAFL